MRWHNGWRPDGSVGALVLLLLGCAAAGRDLPAQEPAPDAVVARVNHWSITRDEVNWELKESAVRLPESPEARAELFGLALRHLIRREVVLQSLQAGEHRVGPSELRLEMKRLEEELQARGDSLSGFLERTGQTSTAHEHRVLWRMAWQRHLDRELTRERMEQWWSRNGHRFDGSTIRVDQILWLASENEPGPREAALTEAQEVVRQLRAEEIDWEPAVRKWSQSPLAKLEPRPDMGWIGWNGPMPESFARAAFALADGGVSDPVLTPAGVHLIRRLERRDGTRTLDDELPAVRAAMAEEIFEAIARDPPLHLRIERDSLRSQD